MQIKFHAPVIFTKNIQFAKDFYMNILDQEIEQDFGKNIMFKSHLSLWQLKPEYEITNIAGNSLNGNTFELYFETEDIEACYQKIEEANVKVFHPIKTEPWGQKTFRFFDPDEHLIEIGEEFNAFIKRIYAETGSLEETIKTTRVPEDQIKSIVGLK